MHNSGGDVGDLLFFLAFASIFAWPIYRAWSAMAHRKEKRELRAMLRDNPQHAGEIQQVIAMTESQYLEKHKWNPPQWKPPKAAKKGGGMGKLVVVALCAIYIISPLDFIPDVLPVLGWGDDLIAGIVGLKALMK